MQPPNSNNPHSAPPKTKLNLTSSESKSAPRLSRPSFTQLQARENVIRSQLKNSRRHPFPFKSSLANWRRRFLANWHKRNWKEAELRAKIAFRGTLGLYLRK